MIKIVPDHPDRHHVHGHHPCFHHGCRLCFAVLVMHVMIIFLSRLAPFSQFINAVPGTLRATLTPFLVNLEPGSVCGNVDASDCVLATAPSWHCTSFYSRVRFKLVPFSFFKRLDLSMSRTKTKPLQDPFVECWQKSLAPLIIASSALKVFQAHPWWQSMHYQTAISMTSTASTVVETAWCTSKILQSKR